MLPLLWFSLLDDDLSLVRFIELVVQFLTIFFIAYSFARASPLAETCAVVIGFGGFCV